ncbi:hypothetical protein B0H67DRAFT_648658 [Lasiosphaeris hirsuta]|uniref:Uncharacterized protein n=1 Tax=Lasiosphaeris hirsuta TaxID=260670 RepID=A0AA40A3K0_9PEZI|nr:hypothetical protein B0H67DRAFT_648658 [Lasiosphaeris hirsuta]
MIYKLLLTLDHTDQTELPLICLTTRHFVFPHSARKPRYPWVRLGIFPVILGCCRTINAEATEVLPSTFMASQRPLRKVHHTRLEYHHVAWEPFPPSLDKELAVFPMLKTFNMTLDPENLGEWSKLLRFNSHSHVLVDIPEVEFTIIVDGWLD